MKAGIITFAVALVLAAIAVSAMETLTYRPLTMAHRGGFAETEENTMKAYENAIKRGIDILETDPKITKDGKWIIMHDDTIDRTTVGTGRTSDLTFEQYQKLRTKGGEPIPTLEQVLELGKKHGSIVFLDMHVPPPDIEAFFKIVDDHDMTDMVIVNTWVKSFQKKKKKVRPEIITCFPWPKPTPRLKTVKKLGTDIVGTITPLATKRMIRKSHKMGMAVVTMPINDEAKIREFIAKSLDIIQTDDPRLTEKVLGALGQASIRNIKLLKLQPVM